MNLTLSAESRVIEDARAWAKAHGTSLNALVRDYLASFASRLEREEAAREFVETARQGAGRSEPGASFRREDLYRGNRFGNSE